MERTGWRHDGGVGSHGATVTLRPLGVIGSFPDSVGNAVGGHDEIALRATDGDVLEGIRVQQRAA
jgi:hypothetical protein